LAEYGLPNATVSAGAGDNAAAAVGTGTVKDGDCNISLGTSGTVFIAGDRFSVDENNALHAFPHASGRYHLMGCILSAASCYKWWTEEVLHTDDLAGEQEALLPLLGENDVYFLPYLMGERSPHNDTEARGCFLGMRPDTDRRHMTLAVMEGVAFALRDCMEVAKRNGLSIPETKICGGGGRSEVWRRIVANVLGIPVSVPAVEEGPAFGAAILAMVAAGEYPGVSAATDALIQTRSTILPDGELVAKYEMRYRHFQKLYPALKGLFTK
jgi:xylulokinase